MSKPKKGSPEDLIDRREAAAMLGIGPRTLRQHAENGNLPRVRVGSNWYYRRGDVTAFAKVKPGRGRPKGGG